MKTYDAQKYYRYDEMMALLQDWAQTYPEMMALSSIGTSYQGREIPLVTLTLGSGKKPAVLLSGNLHSIEIIGSCAVLYFIHRLLTDGKTDPELRELLQSKTVYCIPRINVDGAEANLTTPQFFRGSLQPAYPEEDGVVPEDVDGDSVIRKLRIPNPEGEWYKCKSDDRLMMRVWPGMERPEGVSFYDVVDEGYVRGPVDGSIRQARSPYDIDPNRTFPYDWVKDIIGYNLRPCAGKYPLMDCETRALAQFVLAHPEITMAIDMHSYMGGYISPMEFCQDHDFDRRDKRLFDELGAQGTAISGYISANIFPPEVKGMARGSYTTWLYFVLGIPAWCHEIGYYGKMFGAVDARHPLECIDDLCEEAEVVARQQALLRWDQEENDGAGFMNWHPFRHPQLGDVELGGWDEKFIKWNLPGRYVETECKDAFRFNVLNFRAAGYVRLQGATRDSGQITATLRNTGVFPSTKTYKAPLLGAGDTGMITLLGIKNGSETVLHRERMPMIEGGEVFAWTAALPTEDIYTAYRVRVEGVCAGIQTADIPKVGRQAVN